MHMLQILPFNTPDSPVLNCKILGASLQCWQEQGQGQDPFRACQDSQMKGTLEMFEQRCAFLTVWPSTWKLVVTAALSPDSPNFLLNELLMIFAIYYILISNKQSRPGPSVNWCPVGFVADSLKSVNYSKEHWSIHFFYRRSKKRKLPGNQFWL